VIATPLWIASKMASLTSRCCSPGWVGRGSSNAFVLVGDRLGVVGQRNPHDRRGWLVDQITRVLVRAEVDAFGEDRCGRRDRRRAEPTSCGSSNERSLL
jgi:hypothetical protein